MISHKKSIIGILMLCISSVVLFACSDEEAKIEPIGNTENLRFVFPQGNNECDKIFERIYQTYGVQIIYDKLKYEDILRTWIPASVGDISKIHFQPLTVDSALYMAQYLENYFFKYIPPAMSIDVFYPYIYLLNDYYSLRGNALDQIYGPITMYLSKKGMDFWTIAPGKAIFCVEDEAKAKLFAKQLLYSYIARAHTRGLIPIAKGLADECDFSPINATDLENVTKKIIKLEDYIYSTRGALWYINAGKMENPNNVDQSPDFSREIGPTSLYANMFLTHEDNYFAFATQNILRYTKDEFVTKYGKYPKIMRQYDILINHYLNYGIDIKAITEDLKLP